MPRRTPTRPSCCGDRRRTAVRSLDDVLAGTCAAADALRAGPAGIPLLAGQWAAERARPLDRQVARSPAANSCSRSPTHADVLVIDAGSGVDAWTQQLWQQRRLVLLVTTPDDVAVIDAYATIKHGVCRTTAVDLRVLVNQCNDAATAADVQSRLAAACRRFLRPLDRACTAAAAAHRRRSHAGSQCAAGVGSARVAVCPQRPPTRPLRRQMCCRACSSARTSRTRTNFPHAEEIDSTRAARRADNRRHSGAAPRLVKLAKLHEL